MMGLITTYQRNDFGRLCHQSVGNLLVELDQVADVDIAVVFFEERIFAQLVSGEMVSLMRWRHQEKANRTCR